MRMSRAGGNQRITDFVHVAPIRDAHGDAKANARIAISPVRHGRVDEFRVGHDHSNVVVRSDHSAAGANQFYLAGYTRHFDAVADRDWSLRQDDETADEIARDILQSEADPATDRA